MNFRKRFGIPENKQLVAQISWIIPEKGILDLLEIAKLVCDQTSEVHFVIVGEGPYRAEYTRKAESMGLGDSITWTGLIADPFGEGVYDAADVVCQLSRWNELFGWMIAEAMAHKKPVIATRVGGIPELVVDGKCGHLVGPGNARDAVEKLLKLLQDSELRDRMGEEAGRIVRSRFNLQHNVTMLLTLYGFQK